MDNKHFLKAAAGGSKHEMLVRLVKENLKMSQQEISLIRIFDREHNFVCLVEDTVCHD